MAKSAKKRVAAASTASSRRRPTSRKLEKKDRQVAIRSGTKQSTAIEMLRSPGGATIDALTNATGWQQHSVRGFLAGVVRKRLKLDLASVVVDGVRSYGTDRDEPATELLSGLDLEGIINDYIERREPTTAKEVSDTKPSAPPPTPPKKTQ